MEDYLIGDVIKFWPLSGQFRAGKEELRLPAGYRLLADMRSLRIGVVRWMPGYEEERVERAVMGFVRDGFHLPDRASLGDTDPARWPYPDRDPWGLVSLLGMIHPETKRRFTYIPAALEPRSSSTWRSALGNSSSSRSRTRRARIAPGAGAGIGPDPAARPGAPARRYSIRQKATTWAADRP